VRRVLSLLVAAALVAGCGAVSSAAGTRRYTVSTGAMEPTLTVGQTITARAVNGRYQPHRGDIVVFKADGWDDSGGVHIKRVVGVGGETVACCDPSGKVVVNGTAIAEPYVSEDSPIEAPVTKECRSRRFGPVAVPPDAVFLMGDHRLVSLDSRCLGTVPVTAVVAVMTG
jgi:signal peptidase I